MTADPAPLRVAVSKAREDLASIVLRVQDPRAYCVLTRHGKPVAAVVSMTGLRRIWREEDAERWGDPETRPGGVVRHPDGRFAADGQEAAAIVREVQLGRWQERQVLARAGMEPLEGGELRAEMEEVAVPEVARARRWWRVGRG